MMPRIPYGTKPTVDTEILANIGALIIRIGFGALYTILIIRNAQNRIGNYLGFYITCACHDLPLLPRIMDTATV